MIFRVIIFLIILINVIYWNNNLALKITAIKNELNIVINRANASKKDISESLYEKKKNLEQSIENEKSAARDVVAKSLDKENRIKKEILGAGVLQTMQMENIKIDYNSRKIVIPLDMIELENIELLNNFSIIKISISGLTSDRSDITAKAITIDAEQVPGIVFSKTSKGNSLELYLSNIQNSKQSKTIFKLVMTINLPPGVYEGLYTGNLHVEAI